MEHIEVFGLLKSSPSLEPLSPSPFLRCCGWLFCNASGFIGSAATWPDSAPLVMVLGDAIRDGFRALGVADPFRVGAVTLADIYLLCRLILLRAPETRARPLMEDDSTN